MAYQIYEYNYDFFRYWSHDLAYFLGFLMADGHLSNKGGHHYMISFELSPKDINILEWITDKICPNKPITHTKKYYKKNNTTYSAVRLRIFNKKIYNRIIDIGVPEQKTGNEIIPNKLPNNFMSSFVCGYFDGDGCIYIRQKNQYYTRIYCANEKFLLGIQTHLGDIGFMESKYCKNMYLYTLCMCTNDSIKFREYIYKHRGFCLKRKHDKLHTKFELHSTFWTQEQEEYLINHYRSQTLIETVSYLNRTISSIYNKAYKLGLIRI